MTRKPKKKVKSKVKNKKPVQLSTSPCVEDDGVGAVAWVDELIANNEDVHGAIMLEPREELDEAIVGVTLDSQRFVYSYEKLIAAYVRMFKEQPDLLDDEDAELAAQEWVDYNLVRGVAYMGDRSPVLIHEAQEN